MEVVIMIERIEGMSTFKQREYMQAEHEAHEELVKAGYLPQGYDFKTKDVVVFKRVNEHKSNEHTDVMHFKNWQYAKDFLIDRIIKTTDYFNKSIEELSELRNDGTWTREECLICDDGIKIVFYNTLEYLQKDYEEIVNYYNRFDVKAVLEMQVPNTNNNKYAVVFY
jgi:hypothetical protein